MMGLQFVLTARFKWLKSPYGSDVVYSFHRQISLVAFTFILAHPLLLSLVDWPAVRIRFDFINHPFKEFGDFTRRIKEVRSGQKVYLDGPFGALSADRHPRAEGFVFIAGGIGITPMMSHLRTLAAVADLRRPGPG